jgi:hypothetical protein
MPARKKPVKNLSINILTSPKPLHNKRALKMLTNIEDQKNTFDGENLSKIPNNANVNVPIIKPNCTAVVALLKKVEDNFKFNTKFDMTALTANQLEQHKNCAMTIIGRTYLTFIVGKYTSFVVRKH